MCIRDSTKAVTEAVTEAATETEPEAANLESSSQMFPQDSSDETRQIDPPQEDIDTDVVSTQYPVSQDEGIDYQIDTDNPDTLGEDEPIITSTNIHEDKEPILLPKSEQRPIKVSSKDTKQWNRLPKISIRNELFRVGHTGILYIEDDVKQVHIVGQIKNYEHGREDIQATILWTSKYSQQLSILKGGYVNSDMNNMSSVLAKETQLSKFNDSDTIDNTQDIFNDFSLQTMSSMSSLSAEHT